MSLGQFVKQNNQQFADSYKANYAADNNRPLLVWVNEYKTGLNTLHSDGATGEGVVVDILDLALLGAGQPAVYCNVLWMGSAVRDQLKPYVGSGQPLPIKLSWQTPQGGGMRYIAPEPLEDQWLEYAKGVHEKFPSYVTDQKAEKMAVWQAEQAAAGNMAAQAQAVAPTLPALSGPAPVAQPVTPAAPAPQAAPTPPAPAAPAPAAAPTAPAAPAPAAAPTGPVPPAQFSAPAAPVPPAQPPAAAAAPGTVSDPDVSALLAKLNAS